MCTLHFFYSIRFQIKIQGDSGKNYENSLEFDLHIVSCMAKEVCDCVLF